jgi:hypothetical protein
MGDRGVQHYGKVFLANDVIVSLILRDVHKMDHFTLLIVLKNGRGLEAEIQALITCLDHVCLLSIFYSVDLNEVIEA